MSFIYYLNIYHLINISVEFLKREMSYRIIKTGIMTEVIANEVKLNSH